MERYIKKLFKSFFIMIYCILKKEKNYGKFTQKV
nr:MAG TPA: hypothetical protein [Caudoviricetes sp.]